MREGHRSHIRADVIPMISCEHCGWMEMYSYKSLTRRTTLRAGLSGFLSDVCKKCGTPVSFMGLNFTGHDTKYYRLKPNAKT